MCILLTDLTNLKNTTYNMNSISIFWEVPNCEKAQHLFYFVDLLYPDGTHIETNITTNHNYLTFKNLTKGTTYVITVVAASTTGVALSSEMINVTTANKQQEG